MLSNQTKPQATSNNGPQQEASALRAPSISLPKGGGAIRGMGEKFGASPVTGTGSMTVPIATSPGRSGFGPQLTLSYDSGSGNGPFGLGWSLALPAITRKTDKGLPRYEDADDSDVYILSGAEDLVPVYRQDADGTWVAGHPGYQRDPAEFWVRDPSGHLVIHEDELDGYRIRRYRPRIEGLFARIERWTRDGDIRWRSISKDNITTWYGKTTDSRIADPADPLRVFSWLICQSYDDKGNAIIYHYAGENDDNVDRTQANERNRVRTANRYLKRIQYGNRTPSRDPTTWQATDPAQLTSDTWMFEVVFDYGEGHYAEDAPDAEGRVFAHAQIKPPAESHWPVREDPFSTYRAGFEVRTYRLCRRVLVFHHFPEELETQDCLVRATEFGYRETPIASFITSVTQSGFRLDYGDAYLKKSLPPLEFEYSEATVQQDVLEVDAESLENLPAGGNGNNYQWLDLDGEGLQCVLAEQDDGWYYKRNVSPITFTFEEGKPKISVRFEPITEVARLPSFADAPSASHQFLDLAGDGQLDCVVLDRPVAGFFERTEYQDWEAFRPLPSQPNLDSRDANLRFVDLTGDGHADILISEHDFLTWHPSLAEGGFGSAIRVPKAFDEEEGPAVVFADGTQSIYLADMSGDGLTDIVRIRNGEVCYWPNLGYGRFGRKVTMDGSPWFEAQDQFDPRRVRLADIDGSGVTDVIYLGGDGVRLYFNQSGNSWSEPRQLAVFPRVDSLSSVQALDLLGNGTACLVWTSPLPGDVRRSMRYVDLMGGQKPHLLVRSTNNLGAETRVQYAPSTKFYLRDKRDGKPWITRLPFPVHVVERVETHDRISGNRFTTRYAYHHGYFDGEEREFRGFGMVEQRDTEQFTSLAPGNGGEGGGEGAATNIDEPSHVPPVLTRTWFHTGVYLGHNHVSNFFAGLLDANDKGEYYREPSLNDAEVRKLLLDDTVLPNGLTVEEEREACRALKGSMLRQEVYALDGTDKAKHPYTVTEQNFTIRKVQPRAGNRHAVFFSHPREAINYHYERNPADPRIQHALTLDVDAYGNVLKQAAIGYGRRPGQSPLTGEDKKKQEDTLITYTENDITNPIDNAAHPDDHRTPLPCETRTYELTDYTPTGAAGRYQHSDFVQPDPDDPGRLVHIVDSEIDYEDQPTNGRQRRLIEYVRTLYRPDDLGVAQNDPLALLPLGTVEPLALPGKSYKLAFTPGLLDQVYVRSGQKLLPTNPADVLEGGGPDRGGYVDLDGDGHWWIPSGGSFFSPGSADTSLEERVHARQHFFLPHRYRDPFHTNAVSTESFVTYDGHKLLVTETRDALDNTVRAQNDYRVLAPRLVTDPNRNRTEVKFDTLGMVAGTAVKGKDDTVGDNLTGLEADLTPPQVDEFYDADDPHTVAVDLLKGATTRIVYDLDRFKNAGQPVFAATVARETHVSDPPPADGLKIQISFSYSDGFGREIQKKIQAEPGPLVEGGPTVSPRWVGSGWTIFNNKGKPVRQYEPFFSQLAEKRHQFEFGVKVGVSPILFYDPVERVVATLHPNHTWEKVVFDPWRQETSDVNDTVLIADPKTDLDVGDFFRRLPEAEYRPTWHALRTDPAYAAAFTARYPDPAVRARETQAAQKTQLHAGTPTVAHADSLGRTFLTVAHNKFKYSDTPPADPPVEEFHRTRVILDIEGNQREVIDAKDRIVMRYDYDLLGNRVHQASMEAGERWMLNDVAGKPIRAWDSRGFTRRMTYDPLRRPTELFVTEGGNERLAERTVYGEGQGDAKNHRTRVFQVFDGVGVVTSDAYDFKGNLLSSTRKLLPDYKSAVNWTQSLAASGGTFMSSTIYDALNRPVALTAPDGSVYRPTFNDANLLDKVDVNLRGAEIATPFVTNIDYDAKGQRTLIRYANSAETTYEYDKETFRLLHLKTTRAPGLNGLASHIFGNPAIVQDLHYTYDPAGNITRIEDAALRAITHDQEVIEPVCSYTYDAIGRLIEARGREHIDQSAFQSALANSNFRDHPFVGAAQTNDLQALRSYTESYAYDEVGNFVELNHHFAGGGWTRGYAYGEASLIEPEKKSNRLSHTTLGQVTEPYTYDAHGNMVGMPHLAQMTSDFEDQLQRVDLSGGGTAFYVYDAAGQRVRKVIERLNGTRQKERIYLGSFEVYREYDGAGVLVTLERQTLHIMDDQQRIALVETRTLDTAGTDPAPPQLIRYQFGNHLGSASLELDDQAQIISYEEYTPYGSSSYQAVRSQTETPKRYRYTGKERDEETGLYYHGARYYAPWLGRWTAADPAGLVDGPGLYNYCRGSPVSLTDPNGMQSSEERLKASAEQALGAGQAAGAGAWASSSRPAEPAPYSRLEQVVGPEGVEEFRTGGAASSARRSVERITGKPLTEADIARLAEEAPAALAEGERQRSTPGAYEVPPGTYTPRYETKQQAVDAALRERGKALGIRSFNEEEFQAFMFLVTTFALPALEAVAGPAAALARVGGSAAPRAAAAETRFAAGAGGTARPPSSPPRLGGGSSGGAGGASKPAPKLEKAGGGAQYFPEGAGAGARLSGRNPPISPRQRMHTDGTPGKSQFKPNVDAESVTRTAWEQGTPVFDRNGKLLGKRMTFKTPIGTSPTGVDQYSVFVHWSPNRGIHGVPTTRGEF